MINIFWLELHELCVKFTVSLQSNKIDELSKGNFLGVCFVHADKVFAGRVTF